MLRFSSIVGKESTHLPEPYWVAHELCFLVHDIMTQALVSGEKASVFRKTFEFRDDTDREAFEKASDVFVWLEETRRFEERESFLITTVFPAVLSDMLHCFYEALQNSRKAKLAVSFMLIRKPLQETLYLIETMVADRSDFSRKLTSEPIKLYSQTAGGLDVHTKRIQAVIDILGDANRFDAGYMAQLRYDKSAEDGFDGICNKAMHLFTNHQAIRTENLNINFIFSGAEAKLTQWSYLYSRLPYLLVYIWRLMEFLLASIMPTDPSCLQDMERRIAALVLLWWDSIEPPYDDPHLEKFFVSTRDWLEAYRQKAGYRQLNKQDLQQMAETGGWPGCP